MFTLAVLALAAPAGAAQASSPRLDLSSPARGCEPATAGEVVVCAERDAGDEYRIDPDVLQVMRKQEQAANPPRPPERVAEGDPCKVGPNGCPGEGALPLFAIALTAAKMAVKAVQGEDWREPLRTGPSDYELYVESKRKSDQEKARISVEVGIEDGRSTATHPEWR